MQECRPAGCRRATASLGTAALAAAWLVSGCGGPPAGLEPMPPAAAAPLPAQASAELPRATCADGDARATSLVAELARCSVGDRCIPVDLSEVADGASCVGAFGCPALVREGSLTDATRELVRQIAAARGPSCPDCVVPECSASDRLGPVCNLQTGRCEYANPGGEIGPRGFGLSASCTDQIARATSPGERTPLGPAVSEFVAAWTAARRASVSWRSIAGLVDTTPAAGISAVELRVRAKAPPRIVRSTPRSGAARSECSPWGWVELDVELSLHSEDGALDETWSETLYGSEPTLVLRLQRDLVEHPPRGTLRVAWKDVGAADRVVTTLGIFLDGEGMWGSVSSSLLRAQPAPGEARGAAAIGWFEPAH